MSPLTPDERAEVAAMLRERGQSVLHPDPRALTLADKLEAEPEPRSCQCGDDEACAFVRERDEAREALEQSRALALAALADRTEQRDEAERALDEAREALRDLIAAEHDARVGRPGGHDLLEAAIERGEAALIGVDAPFTFEGETLRALVAACGSGEMLTDREALIRAQDLLAGVERTHTLVPVKMCRRASALYRDLAHRCAKGSIDREAATAHAEAFETAGRGEPVGEWPT